MADPMIRTPREWTEKCGQCAGTGVVHMREHFAIFTPAEYAALMPEALAVVKLDPAEHRGVGAVPKDAMICAAHAGSSIFDACKEGVTLARAAGRPVAFEFNGAVAVCRADDDPSVVAKTWRKLAYGKTYEQSAAER